MKKMKMFLMALLMVLIAGNSFAKAVYLDGEVWVERTVLENTIKFTWKFLNSKDMWANNQVQFCPDPLRPNCDPNVPFAAKEVNENVYEYDVPKELISYGQSALNLANDDDWLDALWLGLPDCQRLHLGKDLVLYKSMADPNIPKSGGMHILYVGLGAPFVPAADDPNLYSCGAKPVAKGPCVVFLKGDKARTDVLKSIIEAYWGAQVHIESGTGHEVTVVGNGGTRSVPISDKLLASLQKLVGNQNAGDSLNSLCPEQAKLMREAIKCN